MPVPNVNVDDQELFHPNPQSMSVRQLQTALAKARIDHSQCIEKKDLVLAYQIYAKRLLSGRFAVNPATLSAVEVVEALRVVNITVSSDTPKDDMDIAFSHVATCLATSSSSTAQGPKIHLTNPSTEVKADPTPVAPSKELGVQPTPFNKSAPNQSPTPPVHQVPAPPSQVPMPPPPLPPSSAPAQTLSSNSASAKLRTDQCSQCLDKPSWLSARKLIHCIKCQLVFCSKCLRSGQNSDSRMCDKCLSVSPTRKDSEEPTCTSAIAAAVISAVAHPTTSDSPPESASKPVNLSSGSPGPGPPLLPSASNSAPRKRSLLSRLFSSVTHHSSSSTEDPPAASHPPHQDAPQPPNAPVRQTPPPAKPIAKTVAAPIPVVEKKLPPPAGALPSGQDDGQNWRRWVEADRIAKQEAKDTARQERVKGDADAQSKAQAAMELEVERKTNERQYDEEHLMEFDGWLLRKQWGLIVNAPDQATVTEIRGAFKRKLLVWHPDKNPEKPKEAMKHVQQFKEYGRQFERWVTEHNLEPTDPISMVQPSTPSPVTSVGSGARGRAGPERKEASPTMSYEHSRPSPNGSSQPQRPQQQSTPKPSSPPTADTSNHPFNVYSDYYPPRNGSSTGFTSADSHSYGASPDTSSAAPAPGAYTMPAGFQAHTDPSNKSRPNNSSSSSFSNNTSQPPFHSVGPGHYPGANMTSPPPSGPNAFYDQRQMDPTFGMSDASDGFGAPHSSPFYGSAGWGQSSSPYGGVSGGAGYPGF